MNADNDESLDKEREFSHPVTVERYIHLHEAQLAAARLEAEGIATYIIHGQIVQMNWLLSNAVGGVQLQVADVDLGRAQEILSSEAPEVPSQSEDEEMYSFTCPRCHSNNTDYVKWRQPWYYVPFGIIAALFGLPVAPTRERMTCHACGHEWDVVNE